MDIGSFLIADAKSAKLIEPSERPRTRCGLSSAPVDNGGGQECPPCTELCLHSQLPTTNMSPLFRV
jgi:hypothetical protein